MVVVEGVLIYSLNLTPLYRGGRVVEKHLRPDPGNAPEEEALGAVWSTLSALCLDWKLWDWVTNLFIPKETKPIFKKKKKKVGQFLQTYHETQYADHIQQPQPSTSLSVFLGRA